MDVKQSLLKHFLAAIAYRTQKALRDAPEGFGSYIPPAGIRKPQEILEHMTSVLGYARTCFIGGSYRPEPLPNLEVEIARFHEMIEDLGRHLEQGTPLLNDITPERLLQGPFADVMTHVGQLAMLRRMADSPVAPENFIAADIDASRLGADQAAPKKPDAEWPEAPAGWKPPSSN